MFFAVLRFFLEWMSVHRYNGNRTFFFSGFFFSITFTVPLVQRPPYPLITDAVPRL